MKAAQRFGQDLASQEYQNAYGRYGQDYGRAFDTFQANRTNRLNALLALTGLGERANTQGIQAGQAFGAPQAANELEAAQYIGDTGQRGQIYSGNAGLEGARSAGNFWTQGADARASGYADAANQWASATAPLQEALSGLGPKLRGALGIGAPAARFDLPYTPKYDWRAFVPGVPLQ